MGSLQDQLLKAGLVSSQDLKKAGAEKRRKRKRRRANQESEDVSLARAYAERARQEQVERDRALNRKREEERRRRELNARLKQLIAPASLNDPGADVPRHFEHNGKIRKLYVTGRQQQELNRGQIGIAYLQGRYHLVSAEVIERVRPLKDGAVAWFAPLLEDQAGEGDDDYGDKRFRVPDDLTW